MAIFITSCLLCFYFVDESQFVMWPFRFVKQNLPDIKHPSQLYW